MFFISNSMPKSASTLLADLQKRAVKTIYGDEGQAALMASIQSGDLPGRGSFVAKCAQKRQLDYLFRLSRESGPFVVKAHIPLNDNLRQMIQNDQLRMSYIYRDPRDAMLSARDNYNKTKDDDRTEFEFCSTFDKALDFFSMQSDRALVWKKSRLVSVLKYEDFVDNPEEELRHLLHGWGLDISQSSVGNYLIESRNIQNQPGSRLRFNKGIVGRYKTDLSQVEIVKANKTLGSYLIDLGYNF